MNTKQRLAESLRSNIIELTPTQWAEQNRVLSKDVSDYDGPLSYRITPYMIKIIDSFMPNNPAQVVSIQKGSQLGITDVGFGSILGWIIGQMQSNTLFITDTEEKVKDQMQGVFNQMINSSGLDKIVGNHNIRDREAKGRRGSGTGDTLKGLSFPNGRLYTLSGQTIGGLSTWSVKYGLYDEVDRWKGVYKSAGDFMGLVGPRHRSFGDRRKLLFASTPEIKQTSNIEPLYLAGNRQKYMIPCIHCGELIELQWMVDIENLKEKAGIQYRRDSSGKFIEGSAMYMCHKCGGTFKEKHKYDMYNETYYAYKNNSKLVCDWVPTAVPEAYFNESYHISTLYSPPGFYSWQDLARQWCSIHPKGGVIKVKKLQAFYNQELGLTWEEIGREVVITQLLKNTRNYDINTIPNALSIQDGNGKIILITCAVDLNGKEDDARLDYEVTAWSEKGSSYSIDHGSIGTFERSKAMRRSKMNEFDESEDKRVKWTYRENHTNNVWDEFKKTIMAKIYNQDDEERQHRCPIFGIDTGHFTVHAMAFVNANSETCYALKGKSDNKYTKYDSIKAFYQRSEKVQNLYLVEGDRVKDYVADLITLIWDEKMDIDQTAGFMNYPSPINGKYEYKTYFHEYEGEKREIEINATATAVGSRWVKKHSSSPNHFWDTRIYSVVCRDIFVEKLCKLAKIPVSWVNFSNLFKT